MATLSQRSSTADGTVESGPAVNWNSTRAGTGLSANTSNAEDTILATLSGANHTTRQAFFDFDTSSLTAGATVSAAVLTLYGNGNVEADTNNTNLSARIYDWSSGGLTTADYRDGTAAAWTGLSVFATFDVGSWNQTDTVANNFTSDAGAPALVSKTATTYIIVANDRIGNSTAPTGANQVATYFADETGTASDPLLTVTYTPGATTITTAAPTALATSLKTPSLKITINAASPTALTTTKFVPVLNSKIVTASPSALILSPQVITVSNGADTTLEPGNASLVVTGQAPNLRLTLTMASPSALTTTRLTPNLRISIVTASPSSLVTTKFTPTLLHTLNMAAPTALTLTRQTPRVSFGYVPGIGTLTLTGISGPTLLSAINLLTASLTLSGKQVFIDPIPGTASLVITLQTPTLTATVDAFGRVVRFNAVDTSNNGTISFTPTVVDNVGTILFIPANVSQEGTMAFTVTNTSEEGTISFDVTSSSIIFDVEEA
jgi:hypothetical protein